MKRFLARLKKGKDAADSIEKPAVDLDLEEPKEAEVEASDTDREQAEEPKRRDRVIAPPITAVVGWLENATAKDAEAMARGFIQTRFDAKDVSYYAVARFLNGYLYEVHEGGAGVSHLPAIVASLTRAPELPVWFPSGRRVFQVELQDDQPVCMLLSDTESRAIRESGLAPAEPTGRMRPAVRKGFVVLMSGVVIFGVGLSFLAATAGFHLATSRTISVPRPVNVQTLPHRQWSLVADPRPNLVADALRFEDGSWTVRWRQEAFPAKPGDTNDMKVGQPENETRNAAQGVEQ